MRETLKDFLESDMDNKYSSLSTYLRFIFDFNKYRRIDAHNVPEVRISEGIAYISTPENPEEIPMNLKKANSEIKTYSYFIEALNLPKLKMEISKS